MIGSSRNFGRGNENGFAQLYRHASTREADKYIGKPGELTYDPCSGCIIVHNGCTPGGCDRFCKPVPLCDAIKALKFVDVTCAPVPVDQPPALCLMMNSLPFVAVTC